MGVIGITDLQNFFKGYNYTNDSVMLQKAHDICDIMAGKKLEMSLYVDGLLTLGFLISHEEDNNVIFIDKVYIIPEAHSISIKLKEQLVFQLTQNHKKYYLIHDGNDASTIEACKNNQYKKLVAPYFSQNGVQVKTVKEEESEIDSSLILENLTERFFYLDESELTKYKEVQHFLLQNEKIEVK